jgi:hypothetical protein
MQRVCRSVTKTLEVARNQNRSSMILLERLRVERYLLVANCVRRNVLFADLYSVLHTRR